MILGKIQARKLPEVFDGGSVIGASRVLGRIEIPEELELSVRMNVCHPSVFLSPGDADAFEAAGIVLSQPLIGMIVTVRGEPEIQESIVSAIHVPVVDDSSGKLSMDEKPCHMASQKLASTERYDSVSACGYAARLITNLYAGFRGFDPREYPAFRVVREIFVNIGRNVHGHDYIKSLHGKPLCTELRETV